MPTLSSTCLAALTAAFIFVPLAARADVGSGLVGNTVELTGAQGTTKIYYPDRKRILVRAPDGTQTRGWWRVKGKRICTRMAKTPENCTDPITEPPKAGSSGTITGGSDGDLQWSVTKGKAF